MRTTTMTTPIGDILESLRPDDLLLSPALAHRAPGTGRSVATLADSAPTN